MENPSRIEEKRAHLLTELAATHQTLCKLTDVLEEILSLTAAAPDSKQGSRHSVAVKQEQLIEELRKWKDANSGGTAM